MCSSSNEWYSTVLSEIKKKKAALGNVLLAWFNRSRSWKLVWLSDSDLLCVYDWNFYYLKWVTKITQWLMTQQLPNPTEGKKATLRADCQTFFTHYNVMFIHAFFHSNFSNTHRYISLQRASLIKLWLLPRALQPMGIFLKTLPTTYQTTYYIPKALKYDELVNWYM